MLVKLGSSSPNRGKNKKSLKPPPSGGCVVCRCFSLNVSWIVDVSPFPFGGIFRFHVSEIPKTDMTLNIQSHQT